jgi:ribulose 1,5-bisphosphate synthetase/thiazole synthase
VTDYDVVVIGAGAARLSAGALLATESKRVLVADRSPVLGGRAMAVPDEEIGREEAVRIVDTISPAVVRTELAR